MVYLVCCPTSLYTKVVRFSYYQSLLGKIAERAIWPKHADAARHLSNYGFRSGVNRVWDVRAREDVEGETGSRRKGEKGPEDGRQTTEAKRRASPPAGGGEFIDKKRFHLSQAITCPTPLLAFQTTH